MTFSILSFGYGTGSRMHCYENPIYVFPEGIERLQSQFPHWCVCERYIPRIGPPTFLQQNRQAECEDIYINCSLTHECGNWDWGHTIPFLGKFVSNFRYYVFAVCERDGPEHFTYYISLFWGWRPRRTCVRTIRKKTIAFCCRCHLPHLPLHGPPNMHSVNGYLFIFLLSSARWRLCIY